MPAGAGDLTDGQPAGDDVELADHRSTPNMSSRTWAPTPPATTSSRVPLLRAAVECHRGDTPDGHGHHDRHLPWLQAAGLERLTLDVFPRIALRIDTDRAARTYLDTVVWPPMWEAALACGPHVGMTEDDVTDLHALTTPGSPRYVLDDPGYYVLHPTILATGRRGRTGRR